MELRKVTEDPTMPGCDGQLFTGYVCTVVKATWQTVLCVNYPTERD